MKQRNSTTKSSSDTLELLRSKQQDNTVFIIGGGPSLRKTLPDLDLIKGRDIICANNSYKLYPDAMCLHFADSIWWRWHQKPEHDVRNVFKGEITTCVFKKRAAIEPEFITNFVNGDKKGGINTDETKLDGNNTGHQAINIATHIGFEKIVLIGFDMNESAKETHWHNEHERATNKQMFGHTMLPAMQQVALAQEELGFKVYNLNRESAIRDFEFADLEDFT